MMAVDSPTFNVGATLTTREAPVSRIVMSSLVDVAKRAGVSIGTASNVIRGTARVSPELRERVVTAVRELEYYPGLVAVLVALRPIWLFAIHYHRLESRMRVLERSTLLRLRDLDSLPACT